MKFLRTAAAALLLFSGHAFAQGILSLPNQNPPAGALPLASGNTLVGLAGTGSAITYTVFGMETGLSSASTYRVLAQGQLATSAGTMYVVSPSTVSFVTLISLANSTGSAVTGVVLLVNGSAAGNQISPSLTIPANGLATFSSGAWRVHDASGNLYQTGTPAFDTTAPAATTPLIAGTVGVQNTAARRDHSHQSPGGCGSIVAATSDLVNTQAQVVSCTLPANLMAAGTTFRIVASGTVTTASSPGNDTFRVRIGPTTLTGNIAASAVAAANASVTTQAFSLSFLVTVRTAGASGSAVGQGIVWSSDATTGAFTVPNLIGITTATVAVDTTVQNLVELTFLSGAADSSAKFQNASIEIVKM